ncbi:flagellar biosynthetic protein FliR [Aestuariivirga sp.]|uniref:flagellar biosynthetic protein FliR n=1 Tax=Aestuariivirga sp. TaxID=2650926 RepID=UPI00391AEDB4
MTDQLNENFFTLFLLFCRTGGCFLFAPGLSSPRLPVQVRVLTALAIAMALFPLLAEELARAIAVVEPGQAWLLIIGETGTGSAIGLMARLFLLALQFGATAASNFIGLSGIPGVPLEETDTGSPLATLVSSAAVLLILTLGLHLDMLRALIDSYDVIRPEAGFPVEALTRGVLAVLSETTLLALRLAAPFLVYGVTVNFALGVANRFAQQLSVYHATTGTVILGGFLLLHVVWLDWIMLLVDSYRTWLGEGGF